MSGTAAEVDRSRPNVIICVADDLGIEGVQCYGGVSDKTPNVDRRAPNPSPDR